MAERNPGSSRSTAEYFANFFEGWTGAGTLVAAYVAAEFASSILGRFPGLLLFLAWNVVIGPMLAVMVILMTLRAAVLAASVWRRLIVLSSIAVPVGIILETLTGGHRVARFLGLE